MTTRMSKRRTAAPRWPRRTTSKDRSRCPMTRTTRPSGRATPYRPSADPLGPVDEEDHPCDGAHRVVADREGAAARRVLPPLRDPADKGDGRPGPADGLGAASAARGPGEPVEGRHPRGDVGPGTRGRVQRERAEDRRAADPGGP